jgi:hypothetical protein
MEKTCDKAKRAQGDLNFNGDNLPYLTRTVNLTLPGQDTERLGLPQTTLQSNASCIPTKPAKTVALGVIRDNLCDQINNNTGCLWVD